MNPRGHIVVVDDQEDIRECISGALIAEGYQVDSFASAEDALEFLRQNRDVGLVLVDLILAGMSGNQFGRMIREIPWLSGLPVVAMSGRSLSRQGISGLCADAFLEKPFELTSLLSTVERFGRFSRDEAAA